MDHHCKRSRWRRLRESTVFVGLASLLWLVFRTGTKPSRIVYPCQRAAAVNSCTLLNASLLPLMVTAPKRTSRFLASKRGIALVLVVIVALGAAIWWGTQRRAPVTPPPAGQEVGLALSPRDATRTPASDIFVVNGTTNPWLDGGLGALIDLMGYHGLLFYRSETNGTNRGPGGLIAKDDVVLVKVNGQWEERGGTNTDLLKALIQAIISHPDGFTGEIVVADNSQARAERQGITGLNWAQSNAENHSQNFQTVVDMFSGSHNVSAFVWDRIRGTRVSEYVEGDLRDGYWVSSVPDSETGIYVSYPKFRTRFGTYISFKRGVWNGSHYEDRLKVINVPVLKTHSGYCVTGCMKHYMGVQTESSGNRGGLANGHDSVATGGMGTLMVEARAPVLNILDAIWVNTYPLEGPGTSYGEATHTRVVMASTDPVALDYWAAKHVLLQAATKRGMRNTDSIDPENTRRPTGAREAFGVWLNLARLEMVRGGFNVTMDEDQMNVYVTHLSQASSSQSPSPQVVDHEPPPGPRETTALNQLLPASPQATGADKRAPKIASRFRAARD